MSSFRRVQDTRGRRSSSRLGASEGTRAEEESASAPVVQRYSVWAKLPALIVLFGSIWVLYGFFADPRFRVSELVIDGANLVQEADARRVMNVVNTNLFRVNARELTARLESEFGVLERASIHCRLPNRVFLSLEEREAVLVWESGGLHWWIGHDGEVLGATEDAGDLVMIHDIKGFARQPEGHVAGVPWGLALEMREAVPAIQDFDYTSEEGLIVYVTDHGWPVYLGHKGDAQVKAAIMWALADELVSQGWGVAYIDLRNSQRPTYKKL